MADPEVGREYRFVRRGPGGIEQIKFSRYADGSAVIFRQGIATIYECSKDAWRDAWDVVERGGYVAADQAKNAGVVPENWEWDENFFRRRPS